MSRLLFEHLHLAEISILRYLSVVEPYAGRPLGQLMRIVRPAVAADSFICLGSHVQIRGFSCWFFDEEPEIKHACEVGHFDLRRLSRPKLDSDAALVMMIHAASKQDLHSLIRIMKSELSGRNVYWDRHNKRIGKAKA